MRSRIVLLAWIALLSWAPVASGYEWHHVVLDTLDLPVYDIKFGSGKAYAGTEAGVFRGEPLLGPLKSMGSGCAGLSAYSILHLQGAGWVKHVINELPLLGATGVGVGDIDDDEYRDIVVGAKETGDCVVWYENPLPGPAGTPFWQLHEVDAVADGAREVALTDLDRDSDLDVIVAVRDENRIVWYEQSLLLPWPMHEVGDPIGGPRGVCVADINQDHRLDIVAGGMNQDIVVWYEAPEDPAGTADSWVTHVIDDSLHAVKGVFAADVDEDGDLDVVAAGRDAGDVVWYEHENTIPVTWTKHFVDVNLPGAVSVWCADLVGDESPEIAVTAREAGCVAVYKAPEAPGDVWTRRIIDHGMPMACALSAGDFDGDGRTDLVATAKGTGTVAWYKPPDLWEQPWQKHVIDVAAGSAMGATAGDLDEDGDVDVVVTCLEGAIAWYENDLRDVYCAFADTTGVVAGDGVYRFRDEPQTWNRTWSARRPYFLREHPLAAGTYYCGTADGLFVSDDMEDWVELGTLTPLEDVLCLWFDPVEPWNMLAGTRTGLHRTTDAGTSWVHIPDIPPLPVVDLETSYCDPMCPGHVFASVGDGTMSDAVWRSDDFGVNWLLIRWVFRPTDIVQDHRWFGMSSEIFVGTAADGIFHFDFNGTLMGDLNTGLPNLSIHRLRYAPDPGCPHACPHLYAGTEEGLYLCDLVGIAVGATTACGSEDMSCLAWPNPWREFVMFAVRGTDSLAEARLRVFDVVGREVWSSQVGSRDREDASFLWNGRSREGRAVPPGVYFYRLETPDKVFHGKMVHLR